MQQSHNTGRLQGSGPLEGPGPLQGSKPLSAKSEPLKRKEFSYPEKVPPLPVAIPRASEPAYRRPWQKPHAFALAHGENGASIWFGCLVASITTELDDSDNAGMTVISEPQTVEPSNLDANHLLQTHLGWYGDVWLYWEVTKGGGGSGSNGWTITLCEVRGPGRPDTTPVTLGGSSEPTTGSYCVKLGTVDEANPVDQIISSDVFWSAAFLLDDVITYSSSSSGSNSSSSIGSLGSGGSSGSEKSSNAIIEMPSRQGGHAALATMESNRVLFEFAMSFPIAGRTTRVRIHPDWMHACEPGTMKVLAAPNGDKPYPVSASVEGNEVVVMAWHRKDQRPTKVDLKVTGIRRGFLHWDMPDRTKAQYLQNEASIRSMYDRGGDR